MKNFTKYVVEQLGTYKTNVVKSEKEGIYRGRTYKHILHKDELNKNFIDGDIVKYINYHMYSNHLNSSQIMCVNFFEPIKENKVLIKFIEKCIGKNFNDDVKIINSKYEYEPYPKEKTNFDFYVELSNGIQVYFEIKYTEYGFGKIHKIKSHPNKYPDKFEEVYRDWLKESLYLKGMDQDTFYKDYQINRNISYIKDENSYVVLLYPFENDKCHKECSALLNNKSNAYDNVKNVDWKEAYRYIYDEINDDSLESYYNEFQNKYLCW